MKTVDEAEAKRIVRNGLDNWIGTWDEFQELGRAMYIAARGVNTIEKREAFVGKYLGKLKPRLYVKKTKIGLSHKLAIESHLDESDDKKLSKADKKKIAINNQLSAQHLYNLSKKSTHVFVVKDGSKPNTNELIIMLFNTRGDDKGRCFHRTPSGSSKSIASSGLFTGLA